jgi:hypothetical protein
MPLYINLYQSPERNDYEVLQKRKRRKNNRLQGCKGFKTRYNTNSNVADSSHPSLSTRRSCLSKKHLIIVQEVKQTGGNTAG